MDGFELHSDDERNHTIIEMKDIKKYISDCLLSESELKFNKNDILDGFAQGPFFGLSYRTDTGQWLPVTKIEIESNSLFGEEADDGMCWCTLTFGSLCKTKQIPVQKSIKDKCSNNCGYKWMPTPELLASIVMYFGGENTVTFDISDGNLRGINWRKFGCKPEFSNAVEKTYRERYRK